MGVPSTGVTNVGLFDNTTEPVPVLVVTPVPPEATARVVDRPVAVPVTFPVKFPVIVPLTARSGT